MQTMTVYKMYTCTYQMRRDYIKTAKLKENSWNQCSQIRKLCTMLKYMESDCMLDKKNAFSSFSFSDLIWKLGG